MSGEARRTAGVTCSWCGQPIAPTTGRMRLHQSETVRFSGQILASFHTACGDALLDACEAQLAGRAATHHALQTAHDLLAEPAEAGGPVLEAFQVLADALADQPHA